MAMIKDRVKSVNKIVYWHFLGGIGIHKFYDGKVRSGILYVIFCWTGLIVLAVNVDLVVALYKKVDSNRNFIV